MRPQSTLQFLRNWGFSDKIISTFFRPFFGGVFLDRSLSTSSRLFLWLFRLFAKGNACLPARGMQAIPRQLAEGLSADALRLKTPVASVSSKIVRTEADELLDVAAVVVAVDAPAAMLLLGEALPRDFNDRPFRRTTTFYFAADDQPSKGKMLRLCGDDKACQPINTIAPLSLVADTYAPAGKALLSVNVVHDEPREDHPPLMDRVQKALVHTLGSDVAGGLRYLAMYDIEHALPSQPPPTMQDAHRSVQLDNGVYLAGDHRDTASINGAMLSGRRAAEAVLASGVGR